MSQLERISPHLWRLADTCNVYLVVDGDAALAIDAGSGAVVELLADAGVERVEWVLHTHHHRDQCWGTPRLREHGAGVAVPEHERHLFADAELYWRTRRTFDNYDDRNTFFAIGEDIPVDATLDDYEEFPWRGYRFRVLPAKGHTMGSSMLLAEIDGRLVAFTGDLLARGGRLYQLHAMEYMYANLEGVVFTLQSIQALRKAAPAVALPSHGDPIEDVPGDVARLERRLMDVPRLGTGMGVSPTYAVSVPEVAFLPAPKLQEISRHLLWGGPWTCSNFYVLLSESGKALFVDYGHAYLPHMHIWADHEGLETMRFVEHHLDELRDDWGVTEIDLVVPTHVHDDHTCGIPYLQRHHGTRCFALDQVAAVLEAPAAWASAPCILPKPIRIDRRLADGETFEWEEYELDVHFMPGQTEFHSAVVASIDGRRVAFTGDNIALNDVVRGGGSERVPFQTTVMRNSFQLWMHRRCAEVLRALDPELVCPGHGPVLPFAKPQIDEYCDFIARKERVFRELVAEPADNFVDLFWARLLPYLATAGPGETMRYRLALRNNQGRRATYAARLLPPPGWTVDGGGELTLEPGERCELELAATAPASGDGVRRLVTASIAIDGVAQGPIAEALVTVPR